MKRVRDADGAVITGRRRSYLKAAGLIVGRRVSPLARSIRHEADLILEAIDMDGAMLMAKLGASGG